MCTGHVNERSADESDDDGDEKQRQMRGKGHAKGATCRQHGAEDDDHPMRKLGQDERQHQRSHVDHADGQRRHETHHRLRRALGE